MKKIKSSIISRYYRIIKNDDECRREETILVKYRRLKTGNKDITLYLRFKAGQDNGILDIQISDISILSIN